MITDMTTKQARFDVRKDLGARCSTVNQILTYLHNHGIIPRNVGIRSGSQRAVMTRPFFIA